MSSLNELPEPPPDEEVLAELESISPSQLPCILRLTGKRRLRVLRRNGPVWIVDHEIGEVAVRTETLLPIFEAVEPWRDGPIAGEIGLDKDVPASPSPAGSPNGPPPERAAKAATLPPGQARPTQPAPGPQEDPAAFIRKIEPSRKLLRQIAGGMFANRRSGMMLQLAIAALVSNILGFAMPVFTMAVYDRVIPHNAQSTLVALTIGIALVFTIDLVLRMTRARLQDAVGLGVNLEMQAALYARMTRAELSGAQRSSGPLTAAFQSVEGLCLTMPTLAVGLLIDLPFVALTLMYISYIGGWVVAGPIVAIGLIAAVGLIAHIASRGATRSSAAFAAQRLGTIDETAAAMEQVKTLGAARVFDRIWLRLVDGASYHGHRSRMSAAYAQQITAIVAQGTTVACLVIGSGLIASGDMTMGALVATSILVNRTIQPVTMVMAGLLRLMAISENAEAAKALADSPEERAADDTGAHPRLGGAIKMKSVTFCYPGSDTPVLRDFSLDIKAGERVAIIGRIGCGKSTIARLMPRLFTAEEGAMYLDGQDIRQFAPDFLRSQISYMSQDLDLFDDSVFENIRVGMEDVTEEQFARAVQASGAHDFVARRPEGYSLRVGPRGRKLSGGERQAIALARALVRDAPVLVLDEPTASMDNQLERSLIERLKPLVEGRTLILCTHRAPALALVDRVIWLDNGKIVADGSPQDVVNKTVSSSG